MSYRQVIGLSLNRYGGRHIDRIRTGGAGVTYGKVCFDEYPRG